LNSAKEGVQGIGNIRVRGRVRVGEGERDRRGVRQKEEEERVYRFGIHLVVELRIQRSI
jgi:hypothetical protein